MTHTKKVGSAGRFGARYGLKLRKKILEIEQIQRQKQKCPFCLKFSAKRIASGIWLCKACQTKFAGRAYEPGVQGKPVLEVPKEAKIEEKPKEETKTEEKKPARKKKIKLKKEEPKEELAEGTPSEELINEELQEDLEVNNNG